VQQHFAKDVAPQDDGTDAAPDERRQVSREG
jgi:hypothetical protein